MRTPNLLDPLALRLLDCGARRLLKEFLKESA
jgi:hypothetical protein